MRDERAFEELAGRVARCMFDSGVYGAELHHDIVMYVWQNFSDPSDDIINNAINTFADERSAHMSKLGQALTARRAREAMEDERHAELCERVARLMTRRGNLYGAVYTFDSYDRIVNLLWDTYDAACAIFDDDIESAIDHFASWEAF